MVPPDPSTTSARGPASPPPGGAPAARRRGCPDRPLRRALRRTSRPVAGPGPTPAGYDGNQTCLQEPPAAGVQHLVRPLSKVRRHYDPYDKEDRVDGQAFHAGWRE